MHLNRLYSFIVYIKESFKSYKITVVMSYNHFKNLIGLNIKKSTPNWYGIGIVIRLIKTYIPLNINIPISIRYITLPESS